MRFQNKVVVITGAARGIGYAIAQRFAREGAMVAVCDKDAEGVQTAADSLSGMPAPARAYDLDVRSIESVQTAVDAIVADYGRIDVLVNNAGITVNAVCPGIVRTQMWEQLDRDLSRLQGTREGEALELRRKNIPLGRLQEPEDVAGVVAFLASEDAAYMTGQSVNVTGGREFH